MVSSTTRKGTFTSLKGLLSARFKVYYTYTVFLENTVKSCVDTEDTQ